MTLETLFEKGLEDESVPEAQRRGDIHFVGTEGRVRARTALRLVVDGRKGRGVLVAE